MFYGYCTASCLFAAASILLWQVVHYAKATIHAMRQKSRRPRHFRNLPDLQRIFIQQWHRFNCRRSIDGRRSINSSAHFDL